MTNRSGSRVWITLVLLSAGMAIAFIERVNLSVAIISPEFQQYFSLDDTTRGLVSTAFFAAYTALQIPAGWIVDRTRPRFVFGMALAIWGVLTTVTGLTSSLAQLVTVRLLLGAAESILTPASMRWIRGTFDESRRGAAIGVWQAGAKLGTAIGVPLSAWMLSGGGWRFLFVAQGLMSLVWLLPWIIAGKNSDVTVAALKEEAQPGANYLRSPIIWGVLTGTFCYQYFFYFCVTWMPAYLMEQHQVSLSSTALYSALSFGGMAALAVAAGCAADLLIQRGCQAFAVRKWFTVTGLVVAGTQVFGVWSPSRDFALFSVVASLCGLGLATANQWALTQSAFPGEQTGRITGLQAFSGSLAGVLAPVTTGWLKQKTNGYTAPVELVLIVLIVGLTSYLFAVREKYSRCYSDAIRSR